MSPYHSIRFGAAVLSAALLTTTASAGHPGGGHAGGHAGGAHMGGVHPGAHMGGAHPGAHYGGTHHYGGYGYGGYGGRTIIGLGGFGLGYGLGYGGLGYGYGGYGLGYGNYGGGYGGYSAPSYGYAYPGNYYSGSYAPPPANPGSYSVIPTQPFPAQPAPAQTANPNADPEPQPLPLPAPGGNGNTNPNAAGGKPGTVIVLTNPGATVTFDGVDTKETGDRHSFTTAPIAAGAEKRVQVKVDGPGGPASVTVSLRGGEKATVDMRK